MYLVMLETNGNQRYIFSSPRLRENIGASAQLTRLAGWVRGALEDAALGLTCRQECTHLQVRDRDKADDSPSSPWVSRASGKVIVRVDEEKQARAVVRHVTRKALEEAPGIDVSGVFVKMKEETVTAGDLKNVHAEAARYALRRPPASARFSQMPFLAQAEDSVQPAAPRLGLNGESNDDRSRPLSLESRVKRHLAYPSRKKLIDLACQKSSVLGSSRDWLSRDQTMLEDKRRLAKQLAAAFFPDGSGSDGLGSTTSGTEEASDGTSMQRLENLLQANSRRSSLSGSVTPGTSGRRDREASEGRDGSWRRALPRVAVIHIDGNGVGAIMRDLDRSRRQVPLEEFEKEVGCSKSAPDALRRFVLKVSRRLNAAVTNAFASAWEDVAGWAEQDAAEAGQAPTAVPVVPVILGGDDVTVVTSGDYALPFAASYLRHYEEGTREDPLLCYLHDVGADAPTGARSQPGASRERQPVPPGALTAAAGVVVTRNGFPFYTAYDLAEKLVARAKNVAKSQVLARSVLTYHALLDSTVLDADQVLDAYSSFTTRPWLLTQEEGSNADAPGARPSGATEPGKGQGAAVPTHVPTPWPVVCQWVRTFREGVEEEDDERHRHRASATPPGVRERVVFPRTRAVRIRRHLSDAVQARLAGDSHRAWHQEQSADNEWQAAGEALGCPRLIEGIGGRKEALLDLLELADLLPASYLGTVPGESGAPDSHDPIAAAAEESKA